MFRRRLATSIVALSCFAAAPTKSSAEEPEVFPGTARWDGRVAPEKEMVEGLHVYFDRRTKELLDARARFWKRDTSSPAAYDASVEPNRDHLRRIIGSEPNLSEPAGEVHLPDPKATPIGTAKWNAHRFRWAVYDDFRSEGLLLEPVGTARASVVVIPDADHSPEQIAGLSDGMPLESQVARILADQGVRVVIPTLLSRSSEFSGNPAIRMTNLSHREWIYRQAYETARHPIGYEVDIARGAVGWLASRGDAASKTIGIAGEGEGGAIALHASALEPRVKTVWVAGYFGPREGMWSEPIDRNVWAFLTEFGGAELASLTAPRGILVEAAAGPVVKGPNSPRNGRSDAASGKLETPAPGAVKAEFDRFLSLVKGLDTSRFKLTMSGDGTAASNTGGMALAEFGRLLGIEGPAGPNSEAPPKGLIPDVEIRERQRRLVKGLSDHTQQRIRTSEMRRYAYWSQADAKSVEGWEKTTGAYRDRFHEELIGKLPAATLPMNPRSVKILDSEKWTGYGVKLDLWDDVVASGVLLWPKGMRPGEKRPVVVCQHGLEGTPDPLVDRRLKSVYNNYAAALADQGYIVYAPQNPYIGMDRFRTLQRKANPLKASLFSVIIRQHERTLDWLSALPHVDPSRIAFYGLSYGGKTAMRVPAAETRYCLSICSADFNEWVVKTTNLDRQYSYMFTIEYDMYEFGLAEVTNYAEMAGLISPRPFLVERGHLDGVAPDEWIGYEFGKVRRHYDMLGIGDRAGITYFNRGHEIDGKGTFEFLSKHLRWDPNGRP